MTEYTAEQIKENRRKWVEALRSGKYKQGREYLRVGNKFCCLGVLADITGCAWERGPHGYVADGLYAASTPPDASGAVGLSACNGWYGVTGLAHQNDAGATFAEIADIIESEPEGLFLPLRA